MEFYARVILLWFLTLPNILLAKQVTTTHYLEVKPSEIIKIDTSGKGLSVAISTNGKILQPPKNFAKHHGTIYFFAASMQEQTSSKYKVVASSYPIGEFDPKFNVASINVDANTIRSINNANMLLNKVASTAADSIDWSKLLTEMDKFSDLPIARNYLSQQLSYIAIRQKKWTEAARLTSIYGGDSAPLFKSVVMHCDYLAAYLAEYTELNIEQLRIIGQLSQYLIEEARRNNNQPVRLSQAGYKTLCSPIFNMLRKSYNLNSTPESTLLLTQIELLLDVMKVEASSNQPEVQGLLLESLWFQKNSEANYYESLNLARQAINLYENTLGQEEKLAKLYSMLSSSLVRVGLYAEAQLSLRKGLLLKERISKDLLSILLYNKGVYYKELGEWDLALKYINYSFEAILPDHPIIKLTSLSNCLAPVNYSLVAAATLNQLGSIHRELGDPGRAYLHFDCALKITHELNEDTTYSILMEKSRTFLLEEKYQQAIELAEQIISSTTANPPSVIHAMLIKLESQIATNRFEPAKKTVKNLATKLGYKTFYSEEISNSKDQSNFIEKVDAFRLLFLLHAKLHLHIQGAREKVENRKWLEYFKSQKLKFMMLLQKQGSKFNEFAQIRHKLLNTYLQIVLNSKANEPEQLSQFVELLESFYTAQLAQNLYSIPSEDKSLGLLFNKWIEHERLYILANAPDKQTLKDKVETFKSEFLDRNIKRKTRANINYTNKTQQISLSAIHENIRGDELLVRYFVGKNNAVVLGISDKVISIKRLPHPEQLFRSIDKYRNSITAGKNNSTLAAKLAQELLPSEFSDTRFRKIVFILDNALHKLPFSALNVSAEPDKYVPLIEKFQIVYTDSATEYYDQKKLTQVSNKVDASISVFANPMMAMTSPQRIVANSTLINSRNSQSFAPLPGSALEAHYVLEAFSGIHKNLVLSNNATSAFLLNYETRKSTILHIASHGYFDPEDPELVGLLTSQSETSDSNPGFLSLNELFGKPNYHQLVVLSGCNTMQGKNYPASGPLSLTRGFLTQGAKNVIGTIWPVKDKSTAQFMRLFYLELTRHKDISRALNNAQRKFASRGRYRHPKYWAGFVLTATNQEYTVLDL